MFRQSRDRRTAAEEQGAGGRSQGQTDTRSRRVSESTLLTSAFLPSEMKALSRGLT